MVMNKIHFHNKFIYPIHEVKEEEEGKKDTKIPKRIAFELLI